MDEQEFENRLKALVRVRFPDYDAGTIDDAVETMLEALSLTMESDDPRSMGWVDDRGLP